MKSILSILTFLIFSGLQFCYSQNSNTSQQSSPDILIKFNKTSLGENVFVFDPSIDMKEVQSVIDTIFNRQSLRKGEFSKNRYAILFKPGKYDLDIQVNYYMEIAGLGQSPEDVVITGAIRSNTLHNNSVLTNFWRSVENLTIIPKTDSTMVWGVSQAAPLRRVHIKGNLQLFDKGYASGGFLADSKVDGTISSGPQQQWFTRNTIMKKWTGSNWNMFFLGVQGAPSENWPEKPYTKIAVTPIIREKPYLVFNKKEFEVRVPRLSNNTSGPTWLSGNTDDKVLKMSEFYIAKPGIDNSESINAALKKKKNILFTPGIYSLENSLKITNPGTLIMGLGLTSIMPVNGNPVIEVSDIDGVTICGLTIDAGFKTSQVLLQVGEPGSQLSHEKNPVFLYDIFVRVGGPGEGSAVSSLVLNSNDVIADHLWLWRADHGNGVGWEKNKGANGIIVNGNNVTIYGLFNEHFQEYQTLWNGDGGRLYFYQSEMPYDPPAVDSWKHDGVGGYASYKVADNVKTHEAWGLGIYNVFYNAPCIVDNAIETPVSLENFIHHTIIFWLNGNKESVVKSIINGKGAAVNAANRKSIMN